MAVWGFFIGRMVLWLDSGRYRLPLPPYASSKEVLWFYTFRTICGAIFVFLITPIIILIPLSFNQEPYFSFTPGMLALDPAAFSTRWYWDILQNGMVDPRRSQAGGRMLEQCAMGAFDPKFILHRYSGDNPIDCSWDTCGDWPCFKRYAMASSDYGAVDFADDRSIGDYSIWFGLLLCGHQIGQNLLGNYLAHAVLGTPFVIITVTATLSGFDKSLTRASANMGAGPVRTFFKVQMPLILPGVISGALFAFITSFDEVVAVLQLADVRQRTIPRQMFSGIREQISPTILAVATILVIISIAL